MGDSKQYAAIFPQRYCKDSIFIRKLTNFQQNFSIKSTYSLAFFLKGCTFAL